MRIITNAGLHRGAALIDYAMSVNLDKINLNVADMIGIISAYMGRGLYIKDMELTLAERLCPTLAEQAMETFSCFEVAMPDHTGGLWFQGPAYDDVCFTHPTLDRRYPKVNAQCVHLARGF